MHIKFPAPNSGGYLMSVRTSILMVLSSLLFVGSAFGQAGIAAFDPEGVYIDASGTLKAAKTLKHKRLAAIRAKALAGKTDGELTFLSLPKLLAEAKKSHDAGNPIPDAVRYMGGMVRLRYVFVDEQRKDLILAGESEKYDTTVPLRPLGQRTGRPVLHLGDLVTALRTCGPGKTKTPFGCTITLSRDAALRAVEAQNKNLRLARTLSGRTRLTALMAAAAGPQPVKYFNMLPDNRFAFVLIEADFQLKRMVLGLDRSPVKEVKSYMAMQTEPERGHNRFWFVADYETIRKSPDAMAYELRGKSVRIETASKALGKGKDMPIARKFADNASKHFEKLAAVIPPFADLQNLTDLSLVAALIAEKNLDGKSQLDLAWALNGYPVPQFKTPKTADTLVNHHSSGRRINFSTGGVKLKVDDFLKEFEEAKDLADKSQTPDTGFAKTVPNKP
jgi:hypothetical protein